jgi:hypothetical protein
MLGGTDTGHAHNNGIEALLVQDQNNRKGGRRVKEKDEGGRMKDGVNAV